MAKLPRTEADVPPTRDCTFPAYVCQMAADRLISNNQLKIITIVLSCCGNRCAMTDEAIGRAVGIGRKSARRNIDALVQAGVLAQTIGSDGVRLIHILPQQVGG